MRPFDVGELILALDGIVTTARSRHSIQVGRGEHLHAPAGAPLEVGCDHFVWRAVNHSCSPNALVTRRSIISRRPVAADEEVTIHYEATEWELLSPFRCGCGSCDRRHVRGFRHLDPARRAGLQELIADHLRPLAAT